MALYVAGVWVLYGLAEAAGRLLPGHLFLLWAVRVAFFGLFAGLIWKLERK
jgi:hypothetical protein